MTTMNADETLMAYLSPLKEETFIRDCSGKIIGRFTPGGLTDEEVYARAHEFIDREQIKRVKAAGLGKGRSLSEVLKGLGIAETEG